MTGESHRPSRSGCAINAAVEVLGDPWSMLVLRDVVFGNRRQFRELLHGSDEGIASNILSSRLKRLVAAGLLTQEEAARGQRASPAAAAGEQMPPWAIAVELGRCLVLAVVVAGVAAEADVDGWAGGLLLGLALWVGFPFVLWTGAVVHERTPPALAAIHAGDWLVKLLVLGVLVGAWQ